MLGNDGDKVGFALAIKGISETVSGSGSDTEQQTEKQDDIEDDSEVGLVGKPGYDKEEWFLNLDDVPDKTDTDSKSWLMDNNTLFWAGGGCLLLILIMVSTVAVVSIAVDKRRKKKEIDKLTSISNEKLEEKIDF